MVQVLGLQLENCKQIQLAGINMNFGQHYLVKVLRLDIALDRF